MPEGEVNRSCALLAASLLALPSPVAARDWPDAGGWSISQIEHACGLSMEYEGPGETNLHVVLGTDGIVILGVTNTGWSAKEGEEYELRFVLDGVEYSGGKAKGTSLGLRPGFLTGMKPDFLKHFAAGRTLFIYKGDVLVDQLSLAGTTAALAEARLCLATVRAEEAAEARERARWAHINSDPFAPVGPNVAPAVQPAQPKANLASLFSDEDYPASALRNGEHGTVGVKLDVGPNGRVTACTVTSSSGSEVLDSATCRLLTSRARFTPAHDAMGNPTAGVVTHSQTWQIPHD
jgi:TonB family protein